MPCYLFTYHGYGTWMPDRKQGYVKRHQGILATDVRMATIYKKNLKAPIVCFGNTEQLVLLDELETACIAQGYSLHHAATDESHAHVLVSWKKNRKWQVVRAKLGESMTRRLNLDIKRRQWFAKSPVASVLRIKSILIISRKSIYQIIAVGSGGRMEVSIGNR